MEAFGLGWGGLVGGDSERHSRPYDASSGDLVCPVAVLSASNPYRIHVGLVGSLSNPRRIHAKSAS
eukprot:5128376-Pyramimonas_sp.AAC.1